jgi:Protein of unknown function (DUF2846)
MYQVVARVFAVGVCLLFAACSTTPLESQTKTQAVSQGRIYFLRGNNLVLSGRAVAIKLNDQSIGDLGNNSYFFVDRDAGAYKVTAEVPPNPSYALTVNVRAGSLTYVEVAPRVGPVLGQAFGMGIGGAVGGALVAATSEDEKDGKAGPVSLSLMAPAAGAAKLHELKK